MSRLIPLLLLAACSHDKSEDSADGSGSEDTTVSTNDYTSDESDTDTDTRTGPTGTTSEGGATASCAATSNALRFACTATVETAAPGTWTLMRDGAAVHTFTTPSGTAHSVTLWGMAPSTDYTWSFTAGAGAASGSLTTGALPSGLTDLTLTTTGTAVTVQQVLLAQACGSESWLVMADAAGEPIWYEDVGAQGPGGGLVGYTWTADGTVLYGSGQTSIHEITPDGAEVLSASGFDRPLHHDLTRGGDYVYALNADQHGTRVVDGFYVLDRTGAVAAEWDLADHVTLTGDAGDSAFWNQWFPGADDWSHANSIWSDGTDVIVSLRWQDTVLKIHGDPTAADFGDVEWILNGTSDTDIPGDFSWTGGGSFDGQHHATPTADGIAVFDNRAMNLDSRAVTIKLDTGAMTAKETASWTVGQHCDIQGGAFPTANDGMLATCATAGEAMEFVAGDPDAVWTLTASCGSGGGAGGGGGPAMARAVPVTF